MLGDVNLRPLKGVEQKTERCQNVFLTSLNPRVRIACNLCFII
jgi:hypothetical protein